jgi:hypothetical protein
VPRQQHAVAEHVTGHVPDTGDGEVVALHVEAERPEVPPHRDPGATGGDSHRLVVVALGAAGGERVAEPEPVVVGDRVGDVGEPRGALVGGDDEIRVVAVVPDHARRRHDLTVDHVVGEIEQPADERAVAGSDLGLELVPARGR